MSINTGLSGVTFGSRHNSYYSLILASSEVGEPEPKIDTIEIPGGDGSLDYTEYFGETKFKDRTITMVFLCLCDWNSRFAYDAALKNDIHGKRMNIVFDDDPGYYWNGRIRVGPWKYHNGASQVTVTAECSPYKMKSTETVVQKTLSSTAQNIAFNNERKSVCPLITSASAITLTIDGVQVTHAAGTNYKIASLVIPAGGKTVSATGSGSVTFTYREGSL